MEADLMARVIGYARVSTADQNLALQNDALEKAGAERIFEDRAGGAKLDRKGLRDALASLEAGDTLVVWRIDRLGRSLHQLIEILDGLRERGVHFRSISDAIDTTTALGRVAFQIVGAFAEFERAVIRERVTAGIAAARKAGRPIGRKSKMTAERTEHARKLLAEGTSWAAVARLHGVSTTTIHRALKRYPEKPDGSQ